MRGQMKTEYFFERCVNHLDAGQKNDMVYYNAIREYAGLINLIENNVRILFLNNRGD